ncbi:MAG TPA: SAM-dependent methyltransferase [Terriglobia bacterium]|nr:SAM-dependent methyltransferase [Terriglobia bacterium]
MTSRLVAAARERESMRADRLFNDPFAGALAGDEGRAMMGMTESVPRQVGSSTPTENPYLSIRTRFLDDVVKNSGQSGIRQFAILAAGMDSRAFRLEWPKDAVVFEVERADVLSHKESVLDSIGAKSVAKRIVVACDLRDDFPQALRNAGFQTGTPTLFLTEGLLPYLPNEETVRSLLKTIAGIAASGSIIALDTVGESFLRSPWTQQFLGLMSSAGVPWQFGTDDPETLLENSGFKNVRAIQPSEFLPERWPYPSLPRSVPGMPRTYLVTASRT